MTLTELCRVHVAAMQLYDWVAVFFAFAVISMKVAGEMKDIELVHYSIGHLGDKLSPGWRFGLRLVGDLRRWAFLPGMVATALATLALDGCDSKSVCLNAVAILFVLGE